MQASKLNTLRTNANLTDVTKFIDKLVAAGVPLDSVCYSEKENKLIIIPLGKESKSEDWKTTTGFSPRNFTRILSSLGYTPEAIAAAEKKNSEEKEPIGLYVPLTLVPTEDSSTVVRNRLKRPEALGTLRSKFRVRELAAA